MIKFVTKHVCEANTDTIHHIIVSIGTSKLSTATHIGILSVTLSVFRSAMWSHSTLKHNLPIATPEV